jgi:hypothetical protein
LTDQSHEDIIGYSPQQANFKIHANQVCRYTVGMLKRLIRFIKSKLLKRTTPERKPLYDAQDPRRLERHRSNRVYHKNLKQHSKAEKRHSD